MPAMTRAPLPRTHQCGLVRRSFTFSLWFALWLGVSSAGHAQSADPRVGSWRLVQITVDSRPQPASRSTWIYTDEGPALRVDVHSVTPAGRPQHWSYHTKRDGADVPVRGNPAVDRIAVTRRNEWIDELVYKKAGLAHTVGTSEISTDGQTLTVTLQNASGGVAVGVYKKSQKP